jgi:hypothetical protein
MHLAEQVLFPGLHRSIIAPPDREGKLMPEAVLKLIV